MDDHLPPPKGIVMQNYTSGGVYPEPRPAHGKPFGMIECDIYRDPSLSLQAKAVYGLLATYANRDREAWPSRERIAAELSTSLRTVARAVKELTDAGVLVTTHTQTSNRYRLCDLGVGGYVPGSGPLGQSGTLGRPHGHAEQVRAAHETDQQSRPASQTTTSGDACAAAGQRKSTLTDREIITDCRAWRGIDEYDVGQASRYVIGAVYAALRRDGMEVSPTAGDEMATVLRNCGSKTHVLRCVQTWVRNAGVAGSNGGSLAAPIPRAS